MMSNVFIKRKILSGETILSAYTHTSTHTGTHTSTHTGARTDEHTDYTKFNYRKLKTGSKQRLLT